MRWSCLNIPQISSFESQGLSFLLKFWKILIRIQIMQLQNIITIAAQERGVSEDQFAKQSPSSMIFVVFILPGHAEIAS